MKLREFQKMMLELYGDRDRKRGIEKTLLWLGSEVGELFDAFQKGLAKKQVAEEIADILAWTCSVANLLDVDIEEACNRKYSNKCPRCHRKPCNCPFI